MQKLREEENNEATVFECAYPDDVTDDIIKRDISELPWIVVGDGDCEKESSVSSQQPQCVVLVGTQARNPSGHVIRGKRVQHQCFDRRQHFYTARHTDQTYTALLLDCIVMLCFGDFEYRAPWHHSCAFTLRNVFYVLPRLYIQERNKQKGYAG